MSRLTLALCVALVLLLTFRSTATAQPKEGDKQPPKKASEIYVIVKAQLYEVDEAFYKKLAATKRLSKEDLEKLEDEIVNSPKDKKPQRESLFGLLNKQKPLSSWEDVNLDPDQEGEVLDVSKLIKCLPSPDQFGQNQKGPKTIREGVSLSTEVQISADRRFVRVKFIEKSVEVEGREKVTVVDDNGKEAVAENVFLKESELTQVRDLPDGGSFMLPLQYRPHATKDNNRWLVVQIVTRIYIEEEERILRAQRGK